MKLEHFEFSAYETGITKPDLGQKYTLNGNNNANFKRYKDAFDDSPTNAFIIKTIVNYIIGNGLIDKSGTLNPHSYISEEDLELLVFDFKIYGSAFPQIINYGGIPSKIIHSPAMRVGLNIDQNTKSRNYMEVDGFWYSWDWSEKWKYVPQFVPMFSKTKNANVYEMMHIKTLSSEPYFPFPDYFSGLKSAKIEAALIDDAVNHVLNGFQGKTIINVNNGTIMDDDAKVALIKQVKKDWTGTENSDGVTVSINEDPSQAIIVDTIEPRGRNEQFVTYEETAEIKLMAAHSALNILFQRPGSSGFSNNSEEIAMATKSLYLGVINPIRKRILKSLNDIFKKINPLCDIDFTNFEDEKIITNE